MGHFFRNVALFLIAINVLMFYIFFQSLIDQHIQLSSLGSILLFKTVVGLFFPVVLIIIIILLFMLNRNENAKRFVILGFLGILAVLIFKITSPSKGGLYLFELSGLITFITLLTPLILSIVGIKKELNQKFLEPAYVIIIPLFAIILYSPLFFALVSVSGIQGFATLIFLPVSALLLMIVFLLIVYRTSLKKFGIDNKRQAGLQTFIAFLFYAILYLLIKSFIPGFIF